MSKQPLSARPAEQGLADVYNAACVLRFLNAIQLLRGNDYSSDRRVVRADVLLREFAAAHVLGTEPAKLSLKDATHVLNLMHKIEPAEGETIFDGKDAHVGFCLITGWIERSLGGGRRQGGGHE
jgi:hypothetical protein